MANVNRVVVSLRFSRKHLVWRPRYEIYTAFRGKITIDGEQGWADHNIAMATASVVAGRYARDKGYFPGYHGRVILKYPLVRHIEAARNFVRAARGLQEAGA